MITIKKVIEKLREIIKQKGLKNTKQREIILEVVINAKEHLGAEDIYQKISKKYPNENMGIATVYKALKFLEDIELINSIMIEGTKKFETNFKGHHDHLVCLKCDKIIEFFSDTIENEQEKIAKDNKFALLNHTMYLYGYCENCA
jgi:Fur family ferric uptake transcriptional regulator